MNKSSRHGHFLFHLAAVSRAVKVVQRKRRAGCGVEGKLFSHPWDVDSIAVVGFRQERVSGMYAASQGLHPFGEETQAERFHTCHLAPFVTPPSLHEHEQVEVAAVDTVVGLEIISRVFHEAFQVTAK